MNNASDYDQDYPTLAVNLFDLAAGFFIFLTIAIITFGVVSICLDRMESQRDSSSTIHRRSSAGDHAGASIHLASQGEGFNAASAAISTLPLKTFAQLKPYEVGCAVCLDDFKDSEAVRVLPECGHVFHRRCIDPWLTIHPTCPICRNSPLPAVVATSLAAAQPAPIANYH